MVVSEVFTTHFFSHRKDGFSVFTGEKPECLGYSMLGGDQVYVENSTVPDDEIELEQV